MATLGLSRCRTVRSCAEATSVSARATAARAPRDTANSTACCLVTGCWLRATAERNHTRTVARTRESIRKFTPRREDKLGGARPIPSPRTHPLYVPASGRGGDHPSVLLRRLLFLRFLGGFLLLGLRGLVNLGNHRSVDRVDVHFVDSGLARDGDVERINELAVLALELARFDGSVGNFLQRCSSRCFFGDLRFFLEIGLGLRLLHLSVPLCRGAGLRRRFRRALVGTRALGTSDGGGSSDGNRHGYYF